MRLESCRPAVLGFALLLLTACASPPSSTSGCTDAGTPPSEHRPKNIVYAVTDYVNGIGLTAGSSTSGGWHTANDLHTSPLVTSDFNTRNPVGRLAQRVPSIEGGGITLLPDGRM